MMILEGKNLCERRKELNFKVIQAAKNKFDLQEVQCEEGSDVDRIFKIDLASKYKNVDYVLEELKSGDSLYITRALKCEWLYESDYAHFINPDYLHHHIFPRMSLKMKTATLKTISIYVRDERRSQIFYEYCMNVKNWNIAIKFLIFTSESFKNELMHDDSRYFDLCSRIKKYYFRKFIGNSFTLADAYGKQGGPISDLPYLYSLDDEKYLDLFEKQAHSYAKFHGVKMSRSILKKHKDRILRNPLLYMKVLNRSELLKYSSSQDAQVYAAALLPDHVNQFWGCNYYWTHKHILDLIKPPSVFEFIKKLFTNKYETDQFEMTKEFYWSKYYNLMTFEERESWALRHLEEQLNVISEDENFRWYEYIEFAKSFKEIKAQIYITTCQEKRLEMLKILVKSAKTLRDLEELLSYYYKRHVNETIDRKAGFIRTVMKHHNVLQFDDACWVAFDLILHSLDIYNYSKYLEFNSFLTVSLIYHIINNKTVSEDLKKYIKFCWYFEDCLVQLNDEKKDLVYNYINEFIISILSEFESHNYSYAVKSEVRQYLIKWEELRRIFHKKDPYPEIVLKYMKLDLEHFQHIVESKPLTHDQVTQLQITEGYLLRCLKKDALLIVEKLPLIIHQFNRPRIFRINLLLRKIALYFSNDIAKQFVEFCTKTLYDLLPDNAVRERRAIFSIVFAIFRMKDENIKTELMDKFAPTNPKIEHDKIGHLVLYIQQAICRFQSYSRPPVPLSKTSLYVKGDYVHFCDDMFNMYLANLPPAQRTEFIKLLLDAPLSVQKRGLRLAFQTFEASELKDIVLNVWKKTKNVSLREILYLLVLKKIMNEEEKPQEALYELFKELTLTIHQDDTDKVFACFSSDQVPKQFRSSYLQIAWKMVAKLPEKRSNLKCKTRVIHSFAKNMPLLKEEFLESLIYDHVDKILCDQKLCPETNDDVLALNKAMWYLTALYIVDVSNETKLENSLKFVKVITEICFDHWNEDHNTNYLIYQVFFKNFIMSLLQQSSYFGTKYLRLIHIFEYLLQTFENKFGIPQMYSYFWDWKLDILMRKIIDGKTLCDEAISINFGFELGLLVKDLKDKNLYFMSFFDKFLGKINSFVRHLTSNKQTSLEYADVHILVSYGLTLTNIFETYVIALKILPVNLSEENRNEYHEVLKRIRDQDNEEFAAFFNDKYIFSDLKVRKLSM